METKIVKKRFFLADYEEEQIFLQEQHKNGWKLLKSKGNLYTFEKCRTEDYIYQLDFNLNNKDEEAYIQIFVDCGWEFIQKMGQWYYFRKLRSEVDGENTIFSDKESKAEMCKRIVQSQAPLVFAINGVILLWNIIFMTMRNQMGISDSIQIPIIIIGTILVLLCVFSLGIYIGIITKVNKKIQALTNPVQDRKK
ncbi:MAG: hypothetical protein K0S47_3551 [Herbinix sp.]|jgi:hypothetical protein|nr:hypothetical protein [Herbinix sp.]